MTSLNEEAIESRIEQENCCLIINMKLKKIQRSIIKDFY